MGRNLKLLIDIDPDVDLPDSNYDGWRLVSFGRKHSNYEDPEKYVKAFDRRTTVTPATIGLVKKLNVGLAHWLSYYEHGQGAWSLIGEGTQCPWDTAYLAGILVWTGKPSDIGAKTLEDRADDARDFLDSYNAWANSNCYWFRLTGEDGNEIESFGGLIGVEALLEVVGEELRAGDNVLVEGYAAGDEPRPFGLAAYPTHLEGSKQVVPTQLVGWQWIGVIRSSDVPGVKDFIHTAAELGLEVTASFGGKVLTANLDGTGQVRFEEKPGLPGWRRPK